MRHHHEVAKLNDLDPGLYLTDVLARITARSAA
jgi:hypothetical protein